MALEQVTINMAGAIPYTYRVDSFVDFGLVPNNTYFYNKADKLVYYKTITGTIISIYEGISNTPIDGLTETLFAGSEDFVPVSEFQDIPGVYINKKITADRIVYDSGWKILPVYNGSYGLANTGNPAYRPSIRVVGREVFINGFLVLPMDDGSGGLDTGGASYPNQQRATLYLGTSGGWNQVPQKQMETRSPIVPTALRPTVTSYIDINVNCERTINPVTGSRVRLSSFLPNIYIRSNGNLAFNSVDSSERNGITTTQYQKTLHYRKFVSRFTSGDRIELYDNYQTSYDNTGTTLKETNNASASVWSFSCNANEGQDLGGFVISVKGSWQLDNNTTIEQIKSAFDSL